jgi:lincosamide nucleotidyltransferase A/C/D/E
MEAAEVRRVLDALERAGIEAGVTGGWGVDALLRRQTRAHGDLDLGIAAERVDDAIAALAPLGYAVGADERPARIELRSVTGRVDLHPIAWTADGTGTQQGFDGETFSYPPGSLSAEGVIDGRAVRCGTPQLQVAFHTGYPPNEVDRRNMAALAETFDLVMRPPCLG